MPYNNQKRREQRYSKSRAVKNSAKRAAAASALKRRLQKEEEERLAGDREPVNDIDTRPEAQDQIDEAEAVQEADAVEEAEAVQEADAVDVPCEESGQEPVAPGRLTPDQAPAESERSAGTDEEEEPVVRPVITKTLRVRLKRLVLSPATLRRLKRKKSDDSSESGSSPPKRTRSQTRRPERAGSASETTDPDAEVIRYFAGKKVGLTNATLRCRGPRVLAANPYKVAKRINSDSTKLRMQKRADAKKVDLHKAVNRNWKECKVWGDDEGRSSRRDDGVRRLQFEERAINFAPLDEPGPVTQRFPPGSNPLKVFKTMLGGESTWSLLRESTNDYIAEFWKEGKTPPSRKVGGRPEGRQIGPVMPAGGFVADHELAAFLGIQFLIGYHRLPELSLFWEQQPDTGLGLGIIQQAMTRERFKFISKHIACASPWKAVDPPSASDDSDDPDQPTERPDPIRKIRPFVDALNRSFFECRKPPRGQSIDEKMVRFKGRSMLRQTMKNKPIKSGFKIWSRCCLRGYTYMFEIYHGARIGEKQGRSRKNEAVERVVVDLCEPLTGQGHVVAFDRFFTSIGLLDRLRENGINAVGTILPSRLNQPVMTKNESNLRPDEFAAKFGGEPGTCRKGIFIWRDTKAFRVASNYHGSDLVKVSRKQRDGSFREKTCPKAIADYVDNMGGVDTANQLSSYYERDRKAKKWWHRLLYSLLETCLVNSWICFNDMVSSQITEKNLYTHNNFRFFSRL